MKYLILLLLPIYCFAQQPAVMDPVLVQDLDFTLVRPQFGKMYRVMLRKNHALLAEGIADSTWVTICYGCQITKPVEPAPVQVDTLDATAAKGVVYSSWQRNESQGLTSAPGWYGKTISYSTTGEAKITFNGTRIKLYGERGHGMGTITIDGETSPVTQAGPKALPYMFFDSGTLTKGEHTVMLSPTAGDLTLDFYTVER